jgi:hypothetical protein
VESGCKNNYEMIAGKCELCNRANALSYKTSGNCEIASCVAGYHPNGRVCEENVQACAAPRATEAYMTWNSSAGAFGSCIIKTCEDGYHLSSNACVMNDQACVIENGAGVKEWNVNTGAWGECQVVSCNAGYTSDRTLTNELSKPCGQCRNKFGILGDPAASSYVQECEIAACMYQGELYNLDNNECVPICDIGGYEDDTGTMIWNSSAGKCDRQCKDGFAMW